MSFWIIRGKPVFLSHNRWLQIRDEILKDKNVSPLYMIRVNLPYKAEYKEMQKLVGNFLLEQHDKNPRLFYSDWVRFDIQGIEAQTTAWDLLNSYCSCYGYAYLEDTRDLVERLEESVPEASPQDEIDSYDPLFFYPMGKTFQLDHLVKPQNWWWKYTAKMNGRTVRGVIALKTIQRLVGELSNFLVVSKNYTLRCGVDFAVLPLTAEETQKFENVLDSLDPR